VRSAAPPSPHSVSTEVLDVLLQGAAGAGLLACQVSGYLIDIMLGLRDTWLAHCVGHSCSLA
jgi:hypothetical protein